MENMMYKLKSCFIILTGIMLLKAPSEIKAQDVALKFNAGTLGAGIELVADVSESVNIRLGGNIFGLTRSWDAYTTTDFEIATEINLKNITFLADWHPFKSSNLRVTGGLVWNQNEFAGIMTPVRSYTIGGDVYTPEDLGDVIATFDFPDFAPYAGIGFGSPFRSSSFGVNFDLGVFYQQSPSVTLHAEGLLQPTESQAPVMENNLSWANLYPVFTLSFFYEI